MATDQRTSAPALTPALAQLLRGADLFQAISLLERSAPDATPLGHGNGRGEALRLAGQVTLAFAPSDVSSVRQLDAAADGEPCWELSTPVMALAGATGPLPFAYAEQMLERRGQRDRAPLDFLDIFHHRWLSFLYRGRKLHRASLQWEAPAERPLARVLGAVANLGLARDASRTEAHGNARDDTHNDARADRRAAGDGVWLRHAALLGPAPRSMARLEALLADRLDLPVRGTSFIGGWLDLAPAQTTRLGHGAGLGNGAVLGRRAWDDAAGIALRVGPIPTARWNNFLPGGRDLACLHALAGRHAQQALDVQVELVRDPRAASATATLGQSRLGWHSWLASGPRAKDLTPVRLRLGSAAPATPAA